MSQDLNLGVPVPADRCAERARADELVPAGTAGSTAGFVLVEVPLPWPSEITDHPAVVAAAPALGRAGLRLQALVPGPVSTPDRRRAICLTRPVGGFDRYRAAPFEVADRHMAHVLATVAEHVAAGRPAAEAVDAVDRTGDDAGPGPGGPPDRPAGRRVAALEAAFSGAVPGQVTGVPAVAATDRHVLVCTHGRRDACCGRLGTRLSVAVGGLGAGVHVWRTSHTGGHRFAPTALLLPEGTAWAYLDVDDLRAISDRTLDAGLAADRYRGCTGLDGIEVQAADGEALRRVGWGWLDHRRSGEVVDRDGPSAQVVLAGESPDGRHRRFRATVDVVRTMPVPVCGRPLGEATKSAPDLRVSTFVEA